MRIYVYFYWTSEDCHGQAILTLHLSVGQVILFPYFDQWLVNEIEINNQLRNKDTKVVFHVTSVRTTERSAFCDQYFYFHIVYSLLVIK